MVLHDDPYSKPASKAFSPIEIRAFKEDRLDRSDALSIDLDRERRGGCVRSDRRNTAMGAAWPMGLWSACCSCCCNSKPQQPAAYRSIHPNTDPTRSFTHPQTPTDARPERRKEEEERPGPIHHLTSELAMQAPASSGSGSSSSSPPAGGSGSGSGGGTSAKRLPCCGMCQSQIFPHYPSVTVGAWHYHQQ